VDIIIQSTDKNFLVPVGLYPSLFALRSFILSFPLSNLALLSLVLSSLGGSIVSGYNSKLIDRISKDYPGRANMSPILDMFITLLSLGVKGYTALLKQREVEFVASSVCFFLLPFSFSRSF
jgi:hypothetical protein